MTDTARKGRSNDKDAAPADGQVIDLLAGRDGEPERDGAPNAGGGRPAGRRRLRLSRRPSVAAPPTGQAEGPVDPGPSRAGGTGRGVGGKGRESSTDGHRHAWRCDCGWERGVPGTGAGLAVAMRHIQLDREQDKTSSIQGLVDRETGELVLRGFDSTGFQRLFQFGKFGPGKAKGETGGAQEAGGGGAGGGGGRGRGRGGDGDGKVVSLPGRQMDVLAGRVLVTDLVTVAFHIVARRLPELVPPVLLTSEASYRSALAQFIEQCVLVALTRLTETFPERFSPQDVALAMIAQEADAQLTRIEGGQV